MASNIAPGFLVASPTLLDPNFAHSVVLLVDHRPEGSLGFVVNRPATINFRGVVDELGIGREDTLVPDVPVLSGGPVAPHTGWIVFDPAQSHEIDERCMWVTDRLRVSASREFLEHLATTEKADRHTLVLGYAGWGEGQLDQEIRQGSWIPADVDESVIFDTPYAHRWQTTLAALGIDPKLIVGTAVAEA